VAGGRLPTAFTIFEAEHLEWRNQMEEPTMPLIQGQGNHEVVIPNQKTEVTPILTDAAVPIEGGNLAPAAWVDIEEALSDEWEIGTSAMTIDAIRALVAGE
jgi:hypothetical protein